MCMSSSPSVMSDTLIYSGEGTFNNKYVHVLAYQNKAFNASKTPNAMILPFPTNQEMNQYNIIDTSSFKSFLSEIAAATKIQTRALNSGMLGSRSFAKAALIFNSGSYTVVLAHDVKDVQEALTKIPENKRPVITEEFLSGYGAMYPNQPIAVCCWENSVKAEPLLWWYEPKEKGSLFVPTMDAHDGNAPNLHDIVNTDHIISLGSTIQEVNSSPVYYSSNIPKNIKTLLPTKVSGGKLTGKLMNGDMWADTESLASKTLLSRGNFLTKTAASIKIDLMGWS